MAVFEYLALDRTDRAVRGSISAGTPRHARDQLRQRGLTIESIVAQRPSRRTSVRRSRVASRLVTAFVRDLATLLGVGVPLLEALDTIAGQHRRGRFRRALLQVREHVAAGGSLAEAMREHPEVFDEMCSSITAVGEDAGALDDALRRLAQFRERSGQLARKAGTALIYPAIVLVMAVAITAFLMTFVVPTILEPLIEMGRPLPLPTRIVRSASELLVRWGWAFAAGSAAIVAIVTALLRRPAGRLALHRLLLRVPVLGEVVRKQAIVQLCVVLSVLLRSGVPFVRALRVAQGNCGNLVVREALARSERAVGAGTEIAPAFESAGIFPPVLLHVLAIGQRSGELEDLLDRLAADYDRDVETAAARFTAMVEPVLIVLLSLVVLTIAMATLLPILEAGDVLG